MTKSEAAAIFGGAYADLARALNLSRAGISQWPDELDEARIDRVLGAALRLRRPIPMRFKPRAHRRASPAPEPAIAASQEG